MPPELPSASIQRGIKIIRSYLKTLPSTPGVYRMLAADNSILYVGKAKNLKARVTSYTRPFDAPRRTQLMVSLTHHMEFLNTRSEAEALLLESSLIKSLYPRFNIALKDDKSFPEILLTKNHSYPRLTKHRGTRKIDGHYHGPFASIWSVNEMLYLLQRTFLLRTCSDHVFANRSRPCLLYQIKRCSAPCTNEISKADYQQSISDAQKFLKGDTKELRAEFTQKMDDAAAQMAYEEAALWRDRLRSITHIQTKQAVRLTTRIDLDVIAIHMEAGRACIQIFFFRAGRNQGAHSYYPKHDMDDSSPVILSAFLSQFYSRHIPPPEILVNLLPDGESLEEVLSQRRGSSVKIQIPQRGQKFDVITQVQNNAKEALARKLAETSSWQQQLKHMTTWLGLKDIPQRIEVYDNSHTQGTHMVGAMIVAGSDGFEKAQYRKYDIKATNITAGDDFAMMQEVFTRRFKRLQKDKAIWPDLVLIDGGKGQLSSVMEMMEEFDVKDVTFVAVSKGPQRNAGNEQIHLTDGRTLASSPREPALWMIQKLRDEAHRFAIGTHRKKRGKGMQKSKLDIIPGVGAKRKKALLHHFGSVRDIQAASAQDITNIDGISLKLAQVIINHLNGNYTE